MTDPTPDPVSAPGCPFSHSGPQAAGAHTYWDYLRLDTLLDLQGGLEGDEHKLMPDELHFIVVHQAFELWFKLMLRELRLARDHLAVPEVPEERVPYVVHHLRRVITIFELAVLQFRVMETLTPQDFLAFRDKLVPASGFQSFQLRELEILLGLEDQERKDTGLGDPLAILRSQAAASPTGALALSRVRAAQSERSLKDALASWMYRTPVRGSQPGDPGDREVVEGFVADYLEALERYGQGQVVAHAALGPLAERGAQARVAASLADARSFLRALDVSEDSRWQVCRARAGALFVESYRELPLLAWPRVLLDAIVELDSCLAQFRSRHARMAERIIGRRMGTGGSSGVDYLDDTTRLRVFKDLWAIRTVLLPRDAVPPLVDAETYRFAR
jgi:tryptophan 2,3-dioxygenase